MVAVKSSRNVCRRMYPVARLNSQKYADNLVVCAVFPFFQVTFKIFACLIAAELEICECDFYNPNRTLLFWNAKW